MRKFSALFKIGIGCLCAACSHSAKEDGSIWPEDLLLQPGDLVFRQGAGWDSRAVMAADRNSCYSHIGIVVDSAGQPMIVHAVPDEHDFPNDYDRIKMDTPATFFLQSRALIGEVMRHHNKEGAYHAAQTALRLYRKRIPFDHDYNDEDSTKMYCTELIIYAFQSSHISLTDAPKQNFHFPFRFNGYLPSQLHASPDLVSIRKF